MNRVRAVLVGCVVAFPLLATGAEVTRVASSFEENDPFGMFVGLNFERTQTRARIVREFSRPTGEGTFDISDQSEMRYQLIDTRTNLDIRIGIYQDLELRYRLPFVFQHNELWTLDEDTGAGASTVLNSCIDARGEPFSPDCGTTGAGAQPMWTLPAGAYRIGFDNMTFGLAYAIFNQKKDDTKPTWVVGLEYEAPTAALLDPSMQTLPSNRGKLGDRNHKYKLFTAFSRKMGFVDPYFQVWYQLPFRGPGWYSNCQSPVESMAYSENCLVEPWTRSETGIRLPHKAGVDFGSEFTFFEDDVKQQRYTLDLRMHANYVGKGRYYNELSGLTLKLNSTTDYLQVGGDINLLLQMAEYVQLRAGSSLSYNTEHLLSDEALGEDVDGNGDVNPATNPAEINPNFDFRLDLPGRRFRAASQTVWNLNVGAVFMF